MPPSVPLSTSLVSGDTEARTRMRRPVSSVVQREKKTDKPTFTTPVSQHRRLSSRRDVRPIPERSSMSHRTSPYSTGEVHGLDGTTIIDDENVGSSPTAAPPLSTSTMYGTSLPSAFSYGMMGGGMPYYGGVGGAMMGPFSGLHQLLFGIQNVIFSLTQAVHLMGTNQQALQLALDSITKMVDTALATFYELRALEAQKEYTPEEQRRRKRLRALRWALLMGGSWLVMKIVRRLTTSSRRKRLTNYQHHAYGPPSSYYVGGMSSNAGSMIPYYQPPSTSYGTCGFMGGTSHFGGGYGGYSGM